MNNLVHSSIPQKRRSLLYWLLRDTWVMTKRSILHILRSLDQLLSVAMFPIMFLILNRYVFGGAIDTGNISYVNFLVAGILVQMLAFGANYTTINLAVDLKEGIVDRFRSLPIDASTLLTGHVISDLLRNIMSAVIVFGVAFLIGFRPTAGLLEWVLVAVLGILFTLMISWLSAILGLFVKSIEAAQWAGFIVIFPLTFASSAFVPTETMPPALRFFADNQPLTHVINAMRSWLVGTPAGDSTWLAFAWCIGLLLVAMPLAIWIFKRKSYS